MCSNKREGCYYLNGEICRDWDCEERRKALKELGVWEDKDDELYIQRNERP